MRKQNSDGTFRKGRKGGANSPMVLTDKSRRARWVEDETLAFRTMGLSYLQIAEVLTLAGRGDPKSLAGLHTKPDFTFSAHYKISYVACWHAFKKAIARIPRAIIEEQIALDTERLEAMYLNMQPGIRKGEPKTVTAAVGVLKHKATINGYGQQPEQFSGIAAFEININLGEPRGGWPERQPIEAPAQKIPVEVTKEPPPDREPRN